MSRGATPEDTAAFKGIMEKDPESKKCFECNYPVATWCDVHHAIFICLDCSGKFRGLGVDVAFVRSATMDGWSDWKPEKLRQMQLGGNGRARKYFDANLPKGLSIKEKYNTLGALKYKSMLETEVAGRPFNDAAWQPPEWYTRMQEEQKQQQSRQAGGGGGGQRGNSNAANANRFQGHGSQPQQNKATVADDGGDWMSTLSAGLSSVASATTKAAEVTVSATKSAVSTVGEKSRAATDQVDLKEATQKSVAAVTEGVSSAWSALGSWGSTGVSAMSGWAKELAGEGGGGDGGGDQKRGKTTGSSGGGVEGERDALAGLAATLPKSQTKYEGFGSDDAAPPNTAAATERSAHHHGDGGGGGGLGSLAKNLGPSKTKYEGIGSSPTEERPTSAAQKPSFERKKSPPPPTSASSSPLVGARKPATHADPTASSASPPAPMNRLGGGGGGLRKGGLGSKQTSTQSFGSRQNSTSPTPGHKAGSPTTNKEGGDGGKRKESASEWDWDE